MQRDWPGAMLLPLLQVAQYFSTSDGPTTAQESILHAGFVWYPVGTAPPRGASGATFPQLPAELARLAREAPRGSPHRRADPPGSCNTAGTSRNERKAVGTGAISPRRSRACMLR